jgi:hypothetical protein
VMLGGCREGRLVVVVVISWSMVVENRRCGIPKGAWPGMASNWDTRESHEPPGEIVDAINHARQAKGHCPEKYELVHHICMYAPLVNWKLAHCFYFESLFGVSRGQYHIATMVPGNMYLRCSVKNCGDRKGNGSGIVWDLVTAL